MNYLESVLLPFIVLVMPVSSLMAQQPENQERTENEKITLHITREENGKTTVFDTTFNQEGNFDVDKFLIEKGFGEFGQHMSPGKFHDIPDLDIPGSEKFFEFRIDSLVTGKDLLGDNLRIFSDKPGFYHFELKSLPDIGSEFEGSDDSVADFEKQLRHSLIMPHREGFYPEMPGGLDQLLNGQDIEKMMVKNKKHGKKIVIKTRRNDRPFGSMEFDCPGFQSERYLYSDTPDSAKRCERHSKHVIIRENSHEPANKAKSEERKVIIVRPQP